MKKFFVFALALATTAGAHATTPKNAVIRIPANAVPTAYVCDGKDIKREKVKSITHKLDGSVVIKYHRKKKYERRKDMMSTAYCVTEFAKAYG